MSFCLGKIGFLFMVYGVLLPRWNLNGNDYQYVIEIVYTYMSDCSYENTFLFIVLDKKISHLTGEYLVIWLEYLCIYMQ